MQNNRRQTPNTKSSSAKYGQRVAGSKLRKRKMIAIAQRLQIARKNHQNFAIDTLMSTKFRRIKSAFDITQNRFDYRVAVLKKKEQQIESTSKQ